MSDRLAELVRQRALVQEHLAWLDREIARATPNPAATEARVASPPAAVATTVGTSARLDPPSAPAARVGAPSDHPSDVDDILEKYRATPGSVHSEVRKGCFLYFAAAFVLLAAAVAILYFAIGSRAH